MRPIQNTNLSLSLERQFQLKGLIGLSVDEVVVPVQDGGDFNGRSPYADRRTGIDALTMIAGGAGRYSGVLITPAPGTIVVVDWMYFNNLTGVAQQMNLLLLRPADVAAATVTATTAIARTNGRMRSTGFIEQLAATASIFHHTAFAGALLAVWSIAGDTAVFEPPRGVAILDGNDPLGPISLAVQTQTVNQAIGAWTFGLTEYLRG